MQVRGVHVERDEIPVERAIQDDSGRGPKAELLHTIDAELYEPENIFPLCVSVICPPLEEQLTVVPAFRFDQLMFHTPATLGVAETLGPVALSPPHATTATTANKSIHFIVPSLGSVP
jgi:hypothetical protein